MKGRRGERGALVEVVEGLGSGRCQASCVCQLAVRRVRTMSPPGDWEARCLRGGSGAGGPSWVVGDPCSQL